MKLVDCMDWGTLNAEYGVRAKRLLPWAGVTPPFGGAWVVVDPGSTSMPHRNEPSDEEEFFICISGRATAYLGDEAREIAEGDVVYLPPGMPHWLANDHAVPCQLYCLWWNQGSLEDSLRARKEPA